MPAGLPRGRDCRRAWTIAFATVGAATGLLGCLGLLLGTHVGKLFHMAKGPDRSMDSGDGFVERVNSMVVPEVSSKHPLRAGSIRASGESRAPWLRFHESTTATVERYSAAVRPRALSPRSTCEEVVQWMPLDNGNPLLLQILSQDYLRVQNNFLSFMRNNSALTWSNLFVLCIDEQSMYVLRRDFGIRCVEVHDVSPTRQDKKLKTSRNYQLWTFRTRVLNCLLQEGARDVVLSDADALWLRDPIPDLRNTPGDILISRGQRPRRYSHPEHGTTMCPGFALFRAGSKGLPRFMRVLEKKMAQVGDDRMGINMVADILHISWDSGTETDLRYVNSTGLGSAVLLDLPGHFQVTYLPHDKYTDDCQATPITTKTIVAKCFPRLQEDAMKNASLWVVDSAKGT